MTPFNTSRDMGSRKVLFADVTIPAAFKVTERIAGSNGVLIVNYERSGDVNLDKVQVHRNLSV